MRRITGSQSQAQEMPGAGREREHEHDHELERRREHDGQHGAHDDDLAREGDRADQVATHDEREEPLPRPRGEERPQHEPDEQIEAEGTDRLPHLAPEEPVEHREHRERLQEGPEKAEKRSLVAQLERGERQLSRDEPVVVLGDGACHAISLAPPVTAADGDGEDE